ncbi:MAG TPA: MFS transporter [Terriglobales bacterium]|nr:MFS transporter [Terriglobales bacterium]
MADPHTEPGAAPASARAPMQAGEPGSAARPTQVHQGVVGFAVALAVLSYLDRVAIAQAAPLIARDLHLSTIELGSVLGVYAFTYAIFEMPSGWLGDRIGARRVLTRIVAWWSVFTVFTGLAWNYWSMWALRLLFGAGEAGGFPNIAKAMATWLPLEERVQAQAWVWVGARWGGAFTPLLVVALLRWMNWRWAFAAVGLVGVVWAGWFYVWYRDRPADHPGVNAEELALLPSLPPRHKASTTPWRAILRHPAVILLCVQYFCLSFAWFFYITWLPTYLHDAFHLSLTRTAAYSVGPLFFNGLGSLFCAGVSRRWARRVGDLGRSRQWLAGAGLSLAAVFLALSAFMPTVGAVVLMMALSCFFNDWAIPTCWAACMDVGGDYAGTVAGLMNTFGSLSGFIATVLTGYFLHWTGGNWHLFVLIMAAMYVPAVLCWPFLNPVRSFRAGNAAGI